MSVEAAHYYQQKAAEVGIHEIPPTMSGEPRLLSRYVQSLSIHHPNPGDLSILAASLSRHLDDTQQYIRAWTPDNPEYPASQPYKLKERNDDFAKKAIPKLLIPKTLKTGKLSDVTLEALAPGDVPEAARFRLSTHGFKSDKESVASLEDTSVYFNLSGDIKSGGRSLAVGAIIVARSLHLSYKSTQGKDIKFTGIKYAGEPLKSNETLVRSLVKETATISHTVEAHNRRKPFRG